MNFHPSSTDLPTQSPAGSWKARGFTLIELLAVIGIVAVLAALLLPITSRVRASGQSAKCLSNLRQMGVAVSLYAQENEGMLPWGKTAGSGSVWTDALGPYVDKVAGNWSQPTGVMECPGIRDDTKPLAWGKGYAMNDNPGFPDLVPESWKRNWEEGFCARTGESEPRRFRLAEITNSSRRFLIGDGFSWDVGVDDLPSSFTENGMNSNSFVAVNRHGKGRSNVLFFDMHAATVTPEQLYLSIKDPAGN